MENYGSFVLITSNGKRMEYWGLSTDIAKLPRGKNNSELSTGSTAYCIDNGELYIYESTTGEWHLQ